MQTYLEKVGVFEQAGERVGEILKSFEFLCPEKLNRIFVTNVINDAGDTIVDSVWAFSESYLLEAREFMTKFEVDVSPFAGSISYIGLEYENVKFPSGTCGESARLVVELETGGRTYNYLSATGLNAEYLRDLVRDVLLPHLKRKV